MLGGVVELDLAGDGARLLGWERLVQRGRLVGVEVVEHHTDALGLGVRLDNVAHAMGKLDLGAPLHDQYLAPAALGLAQIIIRSRTPLRSYSVSWRAGVPGRGGKGSRTSPTSCFGLSSKHTTGCVGS